MRSVRRRGSRFALGLYTAQRRGDVVRIGRQHIRDGVLTVRQQKTGTTLAIPVHAELAQIIDATPIGHLTLLIDAVRPQLSQYQVQRSISRVVRRRRTAAALRLPRAAQGRSTTPRRSSDAPRTRLPPSPATRACARSSITLAPLIRLAWRRPRWRKRERTKTARKVSNRTKPKCRTH